jgi:hypothetical protein
VIATGTGFLPAVVRGTAWFWGARLLAGALVSWGVPLEAVDAVAWGGAIATGWVLAESLGGAWREGWRLLGAALVIALPEAVAVAADRYATATTLGLVVDVWSVASAVLLRVAGVALVLAALGGAFTWLRRHRLTTAARRSPT